MGTGVSIGCWKYSFTLLDESAIMFLVIWWYWLYWLRLGQDLSNNPLSSDTKVNWCHLIELTRSMRDLLEIYFFIGIATAIFGCAVIKRDFWLGNEVLSGRARVTGVTQDVHLLHLTDPPWGVPPSLGVAVAAPLAITPLGIIHQYLQHPQQIGV